MRRACMRTEPEKKKEMGTFTWPSATCVITGRKLFEICVQVEQVDLYHSKYRARDRRRENCCCYVYKLR